jgi:hypothetical protein
MPDADLTAVLAAIRERASMVNYAIVTESPRRFSVALDSQSDVSRLLAAVEAVLARHVPETFTVRHICQAHGTTEHMRKLPYAEERAIIDACKDCKKVRQTACKACNPVCPGDSSWPCPDVMAISRALLGEDGT